MDINRIDRPRVDPDEAAHARWLDRWAPTCPIGNPQRVRACLAYREWDPRRLQLRVALAPGEGICAVVVDEQEDVVYVRALLCYDPDEEETGPREYGNCPVHVYLDEPLADRAVFDIHGDAFLRRYTPAWETEQASPSDGDPAA
ncbi:MAG TPA: hypothetical protein VGI07_12875 [Solirubrobacteraceae bacterium]|jgi:hypothetical protein